MDLRHLRSFVAVAEELHFGRAALRLNISQPPLSNQIQELERELSVQLLQRTKRRVALTEPGRVLLQQAKAILAQAEQLPNLVLMADQGQIGQVNVGFVDSTVLSLLPTALRAYRSRHPEVRLNLEQLRPVEQIGALKSGRIDVGVTLEGPHLDAGIDVIAFHQEPVQAAIPSGHHLAKRSTIHIEDVADEPLIVFPHQRDFGAYEHFVVLCKDAGFTPRLLGEAAGILPALGLVASGMGIALVSLTARLRFPDVVFRPIAAPVPGTSVSVISRHGEEAPATVALLQVLREHAVPGSAWDRGSRRTVPKSRDGVTEGSKHARQDGD